MNMSGEYPKINSLWKRDEEKNYCIIPGEYAKPEFELIDQWAVTEKIDGMNIRAVYDVSKSKNWQFYGRTAKASIPSHLKEYLDKTFDYRWLDEGGPLEGKERVVIYGEGYGPKIQKGGGIYRDDASFIVFDMWINGWWLDQETVTTISNKLGLDRVPTLGVMNKEEIIELVKNGFNSKVAKGELVSEGIVARSKPLLLFRDGKPLMFKLKTRDYEQLANLQ